MNCSSLDLKAYALGESAGAGEKAHIEACEACQGELERLRAVRNALLSLTDEEPPQRIAFVSDKIFEPRWYQRLWSSAPAMGFASAVVLACALVVHGSKPTVVIREPLPPPVVSTAQVQRLVDSAVAAAVTNAVAQSEAREEKLLAAAEKRHAEERAQDRRVMNEAVAYYQKQMGRMEWASNQWSSAR